MELWFNIPFISLLFIVIFIHDVSTQCIKSEPCICMREDGMGYDLTSLKDKKFVNEAHNIQFQPCRNTNLTFNESKWNESECDSTSICMLNAKNESISLGNVEDRIWDLTNSNNEVHLIYRHTSSKTKVKYETKVILLCCHSCVSSWLKVDFSKQEVNNLIFESQYNCLTRLEKPKLSTGSVLVIIFCVFSGLYFIGGAMALKVFRGAIGLELIPNYDFWADLPSLVRDGVIFVFSGCTVVSYDRI